MRRLSEPIPPGRAQNRLHHVRHVGRQQWVRRFCDLRKHGSAVLMCASSDMHAGPTKTRLACWKITPKGRSRRQGSSIRAEKHRGDSYRTMSGAAYRYKLAHAIATDPSNQRTATVPYRADSTRGCGAHQLYWCDSFIEHLTCGARLTKTDPTDCLECAVSCRLPWPACTD